MSHPKTTAPPRISALIMGYGRPIRGDDDIGPLAAARIAERQGFPLEPDSQSKQRLVTP